MDSLNQCKVKEGASDADIAQQLSGQDLITKESKCVIACLHESFGLVSVKELVEISAKCCLSIHCYSFYWKL